MRLLSLLAVIMALGLTACNTVESGSKDAPSVGTGVANTTQDTSKAIDTTVKSDSNAVKSDSKTEKKTTPTKRK